MNDALVVIGAFLLWALVCLFTLGAWAVGVATILKWILA